MEYKCQKCKEIFSENDMDVRRNTDWVPYGDTQVPMYSYDEFCPFCGAEDPDEYEEDEECVNCGEPCFRDGECYNCGYQSDEDEDGKE